jgi:hypothetical protein
MGSSTKRFFLLATALLALSLAESLDGQIYDTNDVVVQTFVGVRLTLTL